MTLQLPYGYTDTIKGEALLQEIRSTDPLTLIKRHAEEIFAQLTKDLAAQSEYVAACLIIRGAHGYEMQHLLLQLHDGSLVHKKWSDLSSIDATEEYIRDTELNLVRELQALRKDHFVLRDIGSINDIGGLAGRNVRVFLTTNQTAEAEWLSCPSPLSSHDYKSNAITRIYQAIGWCNISK